MRDQREVRACQSRVCENGVQPGRPCDKTCQKHTLKKAPHTGVVDHPVEEYVTRAQMTHDTPFDEADMCHAQLRVRPLSTSWAECSVVISCGKVDYDKSG
jgi:hypothetical protein